MSSLAVFEPYLTNAARRRMLRDNLWVHALGDQAIPTSIILHLNDL
jgi:hypothetical protein